MQTVLELSQVSRTYHRGRETVEALKNVCLSVEQGEMVAITGPSGSGKSTLMNILGCLDVPDGGDYYLLGHNVKKLSQAARTRLRRDAVGFVFQNFCLLPGLTARENVELPLVYRGVPPRQRRVLALEALCRVGLSERTEHRPGEMSGGQQQRTALARALVGEPRVLLADEPTGNLDRDSAEVVMELLETLREEGKTVVLITHDDKIAKRAERVVHICDGIVH